MRFSDDQARLAATRPHAPAPARRWQLGAAAAALALWGLLPSGAEAKELRNISFGLPVATINSSYCMFPTASQMGFFEEEGLKVTFQTIAGSTAVVQTVMSGRLDIGDATPEPIYKAAADGGDPLMVFNHVRRPTGSVAVFADSPIRTVEDLRGKKLGAQSLASGNIMLTNGILRKVGIDPQKEVTYLSVGVGAQALQALRSGHVDGLILFDSIYAQMEAMGARLRYIYGPGQEKLFNGQFLVRRSVAESDPELVRGVGRAIAKATIVARENPEACIRMLWKEFPAARVAGMSEAEQMKNDLLVVRRRMESLITPASEKNGLGWYDPEEVDVWNEFAAEGGIIPKKIENVGRIYTNDFIEAYNDFDEAEIVRKAKAWTP